MTNLVLFFFSGLGAFNGLMLSFYFAFNADKKKISNYFLSFLLLAVSIRIIKSIFFYFNPQLANIFIQIGLSACITIGPLLFFYLKSQSTHEKVYWPIHIIPYLAGITIVGIAYPYVEHKEIWSKWIVKSIYLQWLFYLAISLKYIQPIFQKIRRKLTLTNSDTWLLSIYSGTALIWLAYCIAAYTSYIVGALSFTFILYLIVMLLVFKNSKSSTFFQDKEKYKNKDLDADTIETMKQKIALIVEKELFLHPNLTLDETANKLKVSKHILSQYLNEKLGKSFSNFINEHRIEKAKALLQSNKNYTVEGVGYESGFNSKSSFFTSFKKITGKTPTEYQKMPSN